MNLLTFGVIIIAEFAIIGVVESLEVIIGNLSSNAYSQADDKLEWTRELFLHKGFEIKWLSKDPNYLIMEISAETDGYVAVGFSPNGLMQGSDIVMGWIDAKGISHLKDMYAVSSITPIEDTENNYELILASQIQGRTTIRFRRKWNTCDSTHDFEITDATTRLIYAWHDEDPLLTPDLLLPKYHGPGFRGVQSVFLKSLTHLSKFPNDFNNAESTVQVMDLLIGKITIDRETSHYCKIIKIPDVDKKSQIIGFRPLVDERYKGLVYSMSVYECNIPDEYKDMVNTFEKHSLTPGQTMCYTPLTPREWSRYCTSLSAHWGTGSDGLMLPDNIGIPFGNKEGNNLNKYFMFQIQYDNPQHIHFEDSSGLRLFLTDKPREFDASILTVGNKISPFQVVPPKASKFTAMGYCTSECTKKELPEEGIKITHALLNGNLALKKFRLRHIRSGVELPPIVEDNRYDLYYRQFRVIQPEKKVLPGDILMAECEYDTRWKDGPTFGGVKTTDENCLVFLYYYPRVNLSDCRMQVEVNNFVNAMGIREMQGEILTQLNLPYEPKSGEEYDPVDEAYDLLLENATLANDYNKVFNSLQVVVPSGIENGETVGDYLRNLDWTENKEKLIREVEQKWLKGKHYAFCTGRSQKRTALKEFIVTYPKFLRYRSKAVRNCRGNTTRKGTVNRQYPRVRNYGFFTAK